MPAARSLHGGLAHLFAVLIVLQFFLAGLGAFTTIHNKKFDDNNFGPHAILGTLMVLIALVILVVALVGRWSPRATRLSGGLLGLMVLQLELAASGRVVRPWSAGSMPRTPCSSPPSPICSSVMRGTTESRPRRCSKPSVLPSKIRWRTIVISSLVCCTERGRCGGTHRAFRDA